MKRQKFFPWRLLLAITLGHAIPLSSKGEDAQPAIATPLTLDAAIHLAWNDNPALRALIASVASAQGEVVTAATWSNPEVSFAPGFELARDPSGAQFHGDFGLEQTFEWPGKRALRRAVAEKNVAIRQLALDGFRSQLAIRVRRAYFNLLATRERMSLLEQRLTLAKLFAEAARKKVEGGFAAEFEATKAEVEIVGAQTRLRDARAQHDAARVELNSLFGRAPAAALSLADELNHRIDLPDRSAWMEDALTRNPAIKIQEAEVERTGLSLKSIRRSRRPDFTVGPSVEYTRDEQIVGFGVSVPLPLWDRKKGELATATAEQERALAELENLRREIQRDVTIGWQNLIAARESLAFYTPELRAKLKASLDAASQSYSAGQTPLLLYLESQRTYFDTQADYFDALQKCYETQAAVESAAGHSLQSTIELPLRHQ
ncbi:MAG TPA: TolC family protein [Verrucomicrobiae bacterium]